MSKKTKIITIIVSVLLVIAAISLIAKKKMELAKLKPAKQYPIIVKTIKPKSSQFMLTLTSLGLVKSSSDAQISTKIASRIIYLKQLGENVNQGEVVAKLDSSSITSKLISAQSALKSLNSKLISAQTSLKNMVLTHKRTKELLDVKGASIEQYQKEENALSNIKANVAAIKSQIKSIKSSIEELNTLLSYAVIKSPVDGIISKKFANTGDIAMPGRPIYEISSNGKKYILIRLPNSIKPQGIIFNNRFYTVEPLNGTFNGLNEYKADANTNLSTNSRIELSVVIFKGKAIKLPTDAILNDNGKNFVFMVKNNKAYPKKVKILAIGEENVAVGDNTLINKELVVAKPDILLKLASGALIKKEQ
jgi:multidrug efflux pump subunit AcrA (membrane-fusion protein)